MLAAIAAGGLEPRATALWPAATPMPALAQPAERDSVRCLRYDFNELDYVVATAARGLLVLVDEYDPDWKATVDGVPTTIHRVDYLLRGVVLEPGVHRVRFSYAPRALAAGVGISLASLGLTLLVLGAGLVARRRGRPGAAVPGASSAPAPAVSGGGGAA
jgi:hypothetical protein